MRKIILCISMLLWTFTSLAQPVPLTQVASMAFSTSFKRLSADQFPAKPAKEDFPNFTKQFAIGEYFDLRGSLVQLYAYEKGLPDKYLLIGWVEVGRR